MNGHWKPCKSMWKCGYKYLRCKKTTQKMPNSPHIANPRVPSQYLVLFCSKLQLQFSECVNTFSMDIELPNDQILLFILTVDMYAEI